MNIQEKTIVKKTNASDKQQFFACISLFRRFVYFSLLPASTPMEAHKAWVSYRVDYLNKRRTIPYLPTTYYPDIDDVPMPLHETQQMFCSTSNIREFYLHTFVACSKHKKANLYSVSLCAEGGIYSTQVVADSLEKALEELQGNQRGVFDEYLSDPKAYHTILADFNTHRIYQSENPNIWVASAYSGEQGNITATPTQRGKELVFSQHHYTLFIIPTLIKGSELLF